MERHGNKAWSIIAREFPSKTGKPCRERWVNNLDPKIKVHFVFFFDPLGLITLYIYIFFYRLLLHIGFQCKHAYTRNDCLSLIMNLQTTAFHD